MNERRPFVVFDDPGAGLGVDGRVQLTFQQRREPLDSDADLIRRQLELHLVFGDALRQPHTHRQVLGRLLPEVNGVCRWDGGQERVRSGRD